MVRVVPTRISDKHNLSISVIEKLRRMPTHTNMFRFQSRKKVEEENISVVARIDWQVELLRLDKSLLKT